MGRGNFSLDSYGPGSAEWGKKFEYFLWMSLMGDPLAFKFMN